MISDRTTLDPHHRGLLLLLCLLGDVGLLAELLLLEHVESPAQWIPITLLAVLFPSLLVVHFRPHAPVIWLLRAVAGACVVAGIVGVVLHLQGNLEFAREQDPALAGFLLAWEALKGATPALAPGALAQLGLLALLCTHRHPALTAGRPTTQMETHP